MLFYLTADRGLAVVASNAGYHADPAWWLNLQAAPEAFVDLPDGIHAVIGRAANQRPRMAGKAIPGRLEQAPWAIDVP